MSNSISKAPQAPARFADSRASVIFDLLRGLAALMIVGGHSRHLLFVNYPQVTSNRLLVAAPYLFANAGRQAVILFFVLSGYFIGGAVFRAVETGRWLWSDYLLRRFTRLWLVLIPALLLGLFWDNLGIRLGHAPQLYLGRMENNVLMYNVGDYLSPSTFVSNLFFMQTIRTHELGSNGALWSLANEFWYYILFPLGFFTIRRSTPLAQRMVCGVLFAGIALFVGSDILSMFPIWLAGVALVRVRPPVFNETTGPRIRIAAGLVYVPLAIGFSKYKDVSLIVTDCVFGAVTAGFLWVLLSANGRAERSLLVRASRTLARFSYTSYAVHTPIAVFLASLVVGDTRWVPTLPHILMGLAFVGTVLAYAFALASVTEFHTDSVRRRLEVWLRLPSPAPALQSNPAAAPRIELPRA
jgi:peptidoglycan/LPS O-acetylase OafA/YrhL